jgi:hypothetical protein
MATMATRPCIRRPRSNQAKNLPDGQTVCRSSAEWPRTRMSSTRSIAPAVTPRTGIDRLDHLAGVVRARDSDGVSAEGWTAADRPEWASAGGGDPASRPTTPLPTRTAAITASATRSPRPRVRPPTAATAGSRSAAGRRSSAEIDEDVLDLRVQLEGVHSELPTDPRPLVAAERRLRVHGAVGVDRQHTRLDTPRDP